MNDQFFINTVKGKRGPFTYEQLQKAATNGSIPPTTAISCGDKEQWVMAKTIPGLFEQKSGSSISQTSIFEAIEQENVDAIIDLVQHDPNSINKRNEKGSTPLHLIAHGPGDKALNLDLLNIVISLGADVNAKDACGMGALHRLVLYSNAEIISYIVERGADVNMIGKVKMMSPLHLAVSLNRKAEVVAYLLEHGADANIKAEEGRTALHCAMLDWDDASRTKMELLLKHGANCNEKDEKGLTPFHFAAAFLDVDIVQIMMEHGADTNVRSPEGWTPLHLAIMKSNDKTVVKYLLERGGSVHWLDTYGEPLLNYAAMYASCDVVKCLLEHGADLHGKNADGKTAKDVAVSEEIKQALESVHVHKAPVAKKPKRRRRSVSDEDREELRDWLEEDVRNELREELEDEIRDELRDELEGEVRDELRNELEDEVRDELRDELESEVRSELEKEIREEIEAEKAWDDDDDEDWDA